MQLILNWFQLAPAPSNAINGSYNLYLVALSYAIAVLASYVALDLVGRLRLEINLRAKIYWLFGGAFAMGAGIWSMHFIGMLAFILPMPMTYDLSWTGLSLLVAIIASAFALFILRKKNPKPIHLISGGILIGFGIAAMHYIGMAGMRNHVGIHYLPGLFLLSIGIAIFASEAALWFALQSNRGPIDRQFYLKVISALIMGVAICGMHYTGMTAAIFTPLPNAHISVETIRPDLLAIFIAGITGLIISLALIASSYNKHMINAVQNEKEFLNAILDNLEDGIIACDSNGKITLINNALKKNINTSKLNNLYSDLPSYFDLYPLGSDLAIKKNELPLYRALKGEVIHAMEFILKLKNGTIHNVVIDGQPIINENGDKLGAVIAVHDVTAIKKTDRVKSEFVSVVSHELRTPLTSIRGSLGLLLSGMAGDLSGKPKKLLDIANNNCERLLLLINDILDIEKVQAGKMKFDLKAVDIKNLVTESITANKMYGDKFGVKIKLKKSTTEIKVFADPERLLQVLANLISNAVKFSPHGGEVILQIKCLDNKVRVSVTDRGSGIPIEFQSRIFQKFSQADSSPTRNKGGTGLGLSISKAIIEKFGGHLSFESKPNEGSIFYFDLPIYNKTMPVKSKKLLICAEEDQAKYLGLLLENEGIYSDITSSATEAKKFLDQNNYEAIILDLLLPDQDGISFIKELRKSKITQELPIIAISVAKNKDQELLNGDAFLIVDWLEKPVNFDKLFGTITQIKQKSDKKSSHILYVEDDIDTQQVITMLLEKEAKITICSTIKEAIKELGTNKFDLVILDIDLPDGNGCDLIPIFAKYKLPIIIYSAFNLDHEYAKYVSEALVKSQISNTELLATIKKLLNDPVKVIE